MSDIFTELSPFFQWLVKSTTQASVLICVILVVQILFGRKLGLRWYYCLWMLLIVRMLMPWSPQSKASVYNLVPEAQQVKTKFENITQKPYVNDIDIISEPIAARPVIGRDQTKPAFRPKTAPESMPALSGRNASKPTTLFSIDAGFVFCFVWAAGAALLTCIIFAGNFRLWRIIKSKRPVTDQKILDMLEDCKAQMGIETILAIVETKKIQSPALFGFIRPRLLLPAGMLKSLTAEELEHIFLHELAHLKRFDIYLGWVMAVLQILHWFNPMVWFAFYRIRADRELACDGLAMSTMNTDQPNRYGRTIVSLLERFSRHSRLPSMAGILEDKSQIKRRINSIARFKKSSYKWSPLAILLLVMIGCVTLPDAKKKIVTDNKAILPNGVTVELVGICEHPSEGKQWWKPDGNLIKQAPYEKGEGKPIECQNKQMNHLREFAIKFTGRDPLYTNLRYKVPGATRTSSTGGVNLKNTGVVKTLACELSRFLNTCQVNIGVAKGQWQIVSTQKAEFTSNVKDNLKNGFVTWNISEENAKVAVIVAHNMAEYDCKVVAEDKNGKIQTAPSSSGGGANQVHTTKYIFATGLSEIEKFHFQIRPYEWVKFKNVVLKPNFKTDVQVEASSDFFLEQKDILQKKLQRVQMRYDTGRASLKQLNQAKVDLLRVEAKLSKTTQERIEILERIVSLYMDLEKRIQLRLDAGRATQDELDDINLLRLDAENELAKAKADVQDEALSVDASEEMVSGAGVIEVEDSLHDFGKVGFNNYYNCQFQFKNTGQGPLHISKIKSSCGCAVADLDKKTYAPGESGTVKVKYHSPRKEGPVTKHLYILSDDKKHPSTTLIIKALVESKVAVDPEKLELSLREENAGLDSITLTSKDGRAFSIKKILVSKNIMTLDFDPELEATKFVLKPKVDLEKLKETKKGAVIFYLTHPENDQLIVNFAVEAPFAVSQQQIYIRNAEPGKIITRDIWITSKYAEKINIESITSKNNFMEVIARQPEADRVKLRVRVICPAPSKGSAYFSDELRIKLKNSEDLIVRCKGWLAK